MASLLLSLFKNEIARIFEKSRGRFQEISMHSPTKDGLLSHQQMHHNKESAGPPSNSICICEPLS